MASCRKWEVEWWREAEQVWCHFLSVLKRLIGCCQGLSYRELFCGALESLSVNCASAMGASLWDGSGSSLSCSSASLLGAETRTPRVAQRTSTERERGHASSWRSLKSHNLIGTIELAACSVLVLNLTRAVELRVVSQLITFPTDQQLHVRDFGGFCSMSLRNSSGTSFRVRGGVRRGHAGQGFLTHPSPSISLSLLHLMLKLVGVPSLFLAIPAIFEDVVQHRSLGCPLSILRVVARNNDGLCSRACVLWLVPCCFSYSSPRGKISSPQHQRGGGLPAPPPKKQKLPAFCRAGRAGRKRWTPQHVPPSHPEPKATVHPCTVRALTQDAVSLGYKVHVSRNH